MMSLPETKLILAIRDMTKHILNHPDEMWAGTFLLWKENEKTHYKTTEAFYSISKN